MSRASLFDIAAPSGMKDLRILVRGTYVLPRKTETGLFRAGVLYKEREYVMPNIEYAYIDKYYTEEEAFLEALGDEDVRIR